MSKLLNLGIEATFVESMVPAILQNAGHSVYFFGPVLSARSAAPRWDPFDVQKSQHSLRRLLERDCVAVYELRQPAIACHQGS